MDREDVMLTQGVAWEEADIALILHKRGVDWEEIEIVKVFSYIEHQVLDKLVSFAYGFTDEAPEGYELARDVVMAKIYDALLWDRDSYDPARYRGRGNPFENWLHVIVAREACRTMKRRLRQEEAERRFAEQREREQRVDDEPLPNRLPKWAERWDDIEPYLRQLPPIYREALDLWLDLCCTQGLPSADAADRAGCRQGAFKVRVFRARQELRRLLGNDDQSSGGDNVNCL